MFPDVLFQHVAPIFISQVADMRYIEMQFLLERYVVNGYNTAVRTPRKHLRKFPHETKVKEKTRMVKAKRRFKCGLKYG